MILGFGKVTVEVKELQTELNPSCPPSSMSPMVDYTRQLPAELYLKLLDSLDLADVIPVSLVSRWWRLIAFDHPTYWATVTLDTRAAPHEPGYACAYHLVAAQLERSSRSPIAIDVSGEFREEIPFQHALLLLIQSNMYRVKSLDIASESSLIHNIFLCDAPILEELHLKWCPDPTLASCPRRNSRSWG
ncbi:hypothetical protein EXIGLDRAFT_835891 [Exidia glandulosa HHB12029]|uniref:F-box domain-containing protein n=1 Tax=Exidia glandulosa HHB12029 TaxID=1314781 RepID=A0A165IDJ7_EXIGL|nr:hypothetical protein EXIGLDRAFT_835891 [Exidia glandulosa HHB12029]